MFLVWFIGKVKEKDIFGFVWFIGKVKGNIYYLVNRTDSTDRTDKLQKPK